MFSQHDGFVEVRLRGLDVPEVILDPSTIVIDSGPMRGIADGLVELIEGGRILPLFVSSAAALRVDRRRTATTKGADGYENARSDEDESG